MLAITAKTVASDNNDVQTIYDKCNKGNDIMMMMMMIAIDAFSHSFMHVGH